MDEAGFEIVEHRQNKHSPVNNREKLQIGKSDARNAEFDEDEIRPLSGLPYFNIVLSKTHVRPSCVLFVPVKMYSFLPSHDVPMVLTYREKNWKMIYWGGRPKKRFDTSWKNFVNDNDLKPGDGCVFELTECSSAMIKLTVQIVKSDFPPELLERVSGHNADTAIYIE